MEKYIYCISPEYSGPLVQESSPFKFETKVFTDCVLGYNHLIMTNQSSILGYLFLYEEIPEDPTDLVDLINFINYIGDKETVVLLAVNNSKGLDYLLTFLNTENIDFGYLSEFEVVTDSFIKRNLFGSILVKKYKPYLDEIVDFKMVTSFNSNKNLVPVLPNDILSILAPINKLIDVRYTVENDEILNEFKDNALVSYLRINRIKKLFGEEVDYEGMVSRVDASDVNNILYRTVCVMIEEGV